MSNAQNGDVVAQTHQLSNKNAQVNGGTNGEISSRKVTTLRDATQVRTVEQNIPYLWLLECVSGRAAFEACQEKSSVFYPKRHLLNLLFA